jgi:ubiquinol-cytochrome c reductase iron-sulfur subunit
VDISKLRPGEMLGPIPSWRGRPIFIIYRTQEMIDGLEAQNARMADPHSRE